MLLMSSNVENHQAYQLAYLRKIRNYYDRKSFEHSGPGLQINNVATSQEPNQQVSTNTSKQINLQHQNEQSLKSYSYNLVNLCERLSNRSETPNIH